MPKPVPAQRTTPGRPAATRARPRDTGFPAEVKALIRVRAGYGIADAACCEGCCRWLGEHGGQYQHRLARGIGGTADPVISTVVNGLLLCGTPFTGCHGLAEKRRAAARDAGWYLRHGQNPLLVPVRLLLPGRPPGPRTWLTLAGGYTRIPPEGAAA